MPTTLPGSRHQAAEILQMQDRIIKSFPEVASVFGKAGRANTATDPAPTEMFETVINLKPEERVAAGHDLRQAHRRARPGAAFPGIANAWTMPIRARIDMLSTGIRTPIGIKVYGKDLAASSAWQGDRGRRSRRCRYDQRLCRAPHRRLLRRHRARSHGARALRPAVGDLQDVIGIALGGETVTTTVEGLERYGVSGALPAGFPATRRRSPRKVLVPVMGRQRGARRDGMGGGRRESAGKDCERRHGPARPARQGQKLAGPAQHPHRERPARRLDLRRYPRPRHRQLRRRRAEGGAGAGPVPAGYFVTWSGQFEYMQRAKEKLKLVVPPRW